ncbi:MAG TPA: hypothetical protein VN285_07260 [Candidatus Deferrimicrobium sp.]|nr:hypothetical protein [Candidatus Deferrimicrobium sp.]
MYRIAILTVWGLILVLAGTAGGTIHTVNVSDTYFSPETTLIAPGDTVRWIVDAGSHIIHSDTDSPKSWDSGLLDTPGQTFDLVFAYGDGPGPFAYLCLSHPATRGVIVGDSVCAATGDVNHDGMALTVQDLIYIIRMIRGDVPVIDNLYEADLNGDCVIDDGDAELLNLYFIFGISCFPRWPVPTCCYPDTVRGACCLGEDSCTIRSEANCSAIGGTYHGDGTMCASMPYDLCCCRGIRGNVDMDPSNEITISDLTFMVQNIFLGDMHPCPVELNVDGLDDFTITDLLYLVAFLFEGGPPPVPCP